MMSQPQASQAATAQQMDCSSVVRRFTPRLPEGVRAGQKEPAT